MIFYFFFIYCKDKMIININKEVLGCIPILKNNKILKYLVIKFPMRIRSLTIILNKINYYSKNKKINL
jgi:hypothetical protein